MSFDGAGGPGAKKQKVGNNLDASQGEMLAVGEAPEEVVAGEQSWRRATPSCGR